jgi:hypothetical protein
MPRPRPPYLSHERNRLGTLVWYVRVRGKRIRIRETYGTPEFDAAYQAALAGNAVVKKAASDVAAGTLKWLRQHGSMSCPRRLGASVATFTNGSSPLQAMRRSHK